MFGSTTTHDTLGAVIAYCDAFAIRLRTSDRCGSSGSSRRTTRTPVATVGIVLKRIRGTSDSQGGIHVGQGQNHPQGDAHGDALLGRLLHDDYRV